MKFDGQTISYYDDHAMAYTAETSGASMEDVLARFSALLPPESSVLDWGCGSGRDAKALALKGFSVVATDASLAMCNAAQNEFDGCIRNEGFLDLADINTFDGIWACASLLHLRYAELTEAIAHAHRALKPHGIMYVSFKLGTFEGYRNGRWFTDMTEQRLRSVSADNFTVSEVWESADVRPERSGELWLNALLLKAS